MGIMHCPNCKNKVSDSLDKCIHCGYLFESKVCPDCGQRVEIECKTCPECGHYFDFVTVSDENSDFWYVIGEKRLSHFYGSGPEVIIPRRLGIDSTGNGSDCVFYNKKTIKSVRIPFGLTTIGWRSFEGCGSLESVDLPDSLTAIEGSAFCGCYSLKSISLPGNLTTIGDRAFEGCASLKSISLPDGLTTIEPSTFKGCKSLESINLPDGLKTIGWNAFEDCESLLLNKYENGLYLGSKNNKFLIFIKPISDVDASITIHENCKFIYQFRSNAIKSVRIPFGVTAICEQAFSNCEFLESIDLPNSLTTIGNKAFANCKSLKSISLPDGLTTIGDSTFYNCESLESIILPDSLTTIKNYAFQNCTSLKSIAIPETVALLKIDENSFRDSSFTTIMISRNTRIEYDGKLIEEEAVEKKYYVNFTVKYITKQDAQYTISEHAPKAKQEIDEKKPGLNPAKTSSILNPSEIKKKQESSNNNASNDFDTPIISRGINAIHKGLLTNKNISSVVIPNETVYIGSNAFSGCLSLESVVISDGVEFIERDAFSDCSSLKTIRIPSGVKNIDIAFEGCPSLVFSSYKNGLYLGNEKNDHVALVKPINKEISSIEIHKDCRVICGSAFSGCSSLQALSIPNGVVSIGANAFSGCASLKSVNIPDTVVRIGKNAFGDCRSLNFAIYDNCYYLGNESNRYLALVSLPLTSNNQKTVSVNKDCKVVCSAYSPDGVGTNIKSIKMNAGLISICEHAFSSFKNLKTIKIPKTTKLIGDYAFCNSSLQSIEIPEGVEEIGVGAFSGLAHLKKAKLPKSLKMIGFMAFGRSSGKIVYSGSRNEWGKVVKLDDYNLSPSQRKLIKFRKLDRVVKAKYDELFRIAGCKFIVRISPASIGSSEKAKGLYDVPIEDVIIDNWADVEKYIKEQTVYKVLQRVAYARVFIDSGKRPIDYLDNNFKFVYGSGVLFMKCKMTKESEKKMKAIVAIVTEYIKNNK